VVEATLQPLHSENEPPTPIIEEAGWVSQPVSMDMEEKNSLVLTRVRTPDRQPTAKCQTDYAIWTIVASTVKKPNLFTSIFIRKRFFRINISALSYPQYDT